MSTRVHGWCGVCRRTGGCDHLNPSRGITCRPCGKTLDLCRCEFRKEPKPADQAAPAMQLPTDSKERKAIPLMRGCVDYFPAALAAVARLSLAGNEKHNPGEELHHARGKSMDHADCILRHQIDRGTIDPEDGMRHSTKVAWRALAQLQEELEREEGAPLARGARAATPPPLEVEVECADPACADRCTEPSVLVKHDDPTVRLRCGDCGKTWPMDDSLSCPECK